MKDRLYVIGFVIVIILFAVGIVDECLDQCNPDGSGYGPIKTRIWK